jgi:Flp pilus assembly protein TadG
MMRKLIACRRRRRDAGDSGAAAVEFAITAPLLVMFVLGVADYGSVTNTEAYLLGATRAGAEYAKANWNNPTVTNVVGQIEQQVCGFWGATPNAAGLCSSSTVMTSVNSTVTTSVPAPICTCVDGSSATCPAVNAANSCAAKADPRVLVYVSPTASDAFTPLIPFTKFTFTTPMVATTATRTQ